MRKIDASPGRKEKATPSKLSLNEQSETLLLATPELKLKPVKVLLSSSPKHVRERKSTSKPVVDLNAKDIIDIVEQKRHNKVSMCDPLRENPAKVKNFSSIHNCIF